MALILSLGSLVQTKKNHPCGSDLWQVVRTGADYKLKCQGCGRVVMLSSEEVKKNLKRVVREGLNEI